MSAREVESNPHGSKKSITRSGRVRRRSRHSPMGSARLILLLTKALALRRVAVVTGGTRGIGRGISEALAEHDFDLLVSYNSDAAAAEQAAGELKAKYRCAVACVGGDVSLPETRAKIWETFDKVENGVLEAIWQEKILDAVDKQLRLDESWTVVQGKNRKAK